MQNNMSWARTASGFLDLILRHPKVAIAVVWLAAFAGYFFWRLKEPIQPYQPELLGIGAVVSAVSVYCLRREIRDPEPRFKATLFSAATTVIGMVLMYLGLRV